MSGTTISAPAGFFINDTVTPQTAEDLDSVVTACESNATAAAASATSAAASATSAAATLTSVGTAAATAIAAINSAATTAETAISADTASATTAATNAGNSATAAAASATTASNAAANLLAGTPVNLNSMAVNTTGGSSTAVQIYQEVAAGITFSDAAQSVTIQPSGATLGQYTGFATYIRNQNAVNHSTGYQNAVALFGLGVSEVDNAFTWGVNTVLADTATPGTGTGTGRLLQNELDFNISYASTTANGLALGGVWYAQPIVNGVVVLAPTCHGGTYRWGAGFITGDNAASNAFAAGLLGAAGTASLSSQPIIMGNTDGSGTRHTLKIQATTGNVLAITGDTEASLNVQGGITAGDTSTFVTPAAFDSSTQPATTAWVTAAGPMVPSQTVISATVALTNAAAGHFLPITAAGITITLPQASTMPGASLFFHNESSGAVTFAAHSGDSTPVTSAASDGVLWLVSHGTSWFAMVNTRGNPKTSITGSRGSATATVIENLLTALVAMGLVTDNTTA